MSIEATDSARADLLPSSGLETERISSGNNFELLPTAEEYWGRLKEDIDNAKDNINISSFLMNNSGIADEVMSHLEAATFRGVNVRLMTDGMFPIPARWFVTGGLIKRIHNFQKELRKIHREQKKGKKYTDQKIGNLYFAWPRERGGRRSIWSWAKDRTIRRDHTKLTVIDGKKAYLGGRNIWREDADNRDFMVRMTGDVVKSAQESFEDTWAGRPNAGIYPKDAKIGEDTCIVRDVRSSEKIFDGLIESIENAKDRVWIETPYFDRVNLLPVFIALGKRNKDLIEIGDKPLDIKLVTTAPPSNNHRNYRMSAPWFLNEIAHAGNGSGIQIYGYLKENGKTKTKFTLNHSKAVLVDDLAIIGSSNFNKLEIWGGGNAETNLFTKEKSLVEALEGWFEEEFSESLKVAPKESTVPEKIYRKIRDIDKIPGKLYGTIRRWTPKF
ncbi:MAG TPA: phosphatidylserine/phosphatidylglycerophosphate/cardiolipin synthase family protein [Patescibacteria group bacterium]